MIVVEKGIGERSARLAVLHILDVSEHPCVVLFHQCHVSIRLWLRNEIDCEVAGPLPEISERVRVNFLK